MFRSKTLRYMQVMVVSTDDWPIRMLATELLALWGRDSHGRRQVEKCGVDAPANSDTICHWLSDSAIGDMQYSKHSRFTVLFTMGAGT